MAANYEALGDKTQAFVLLDKAFSERDFILAQCRADVRPTPLRPTLRRPPAAHETAAITLTMNGWSTGSV